MKERQKRLQQEIRRIARENQIQEKDFLLVEDTIWKFVKERIQQTDNEKEEGSNIYLRFLGTIFIAPNKIKKIKENIKCTQ